MKIYSLFLIVSLSACGVTKVKNQNTGRSLEEITKRTLKSKPKECPERFAEQPFESVIEYREDETDPDSDSYILCLYSGKATVDQILKENIKKFETITCCASTSEDIETRLPKNFRHTQRWSIGMKTEENSSGYLSVGVFVQADLSQRPHVSESNVNQEQETIRLVLKSDKEINISSARFGSCRFNTRSEIDLSNESWFYQKGQFVLSLGNAIDMNASRVRIEILGSRLYDSMTCDVGSFDKLIEQLEKNFEIIYTNSREGFYEKINEKFLTNNNFLIKNNNCEHSFNPIDKSTLTRSAMSLIPNNQYQMLYAFETIKVLNVLQNQSVWRMKSTETDLVCDFLLNPQTPRVVPVGTRFIIIGQYKERSPKLSYQLKLESAEREYADRVVCNRNPRSVQELRVIAKDNFEIKEASFKLD